MGHSTTGGSRVWSWRIAGWSAAALLLALPLIAMQFTDEVVWKAADFALFGAMLVSAGAVLELAFRPPANLSYRLGIGVAVVAGFLLTWVNGAVGIIDGPHSQWNILYAGVVAVGVVGAAIARLQPRGMFWTMLVVALVQASITIVVSINGLRESGPGLSFATVMLSGCFIPLFLLSAWLFWRSDRP